MTTHTSKALSHELNLVHQTIIGPMRSRVWRDPNPKPGERRRTRLIIDRIDDPEPEHRLQVELSYIEAIMLKTAIDEAVRAATRVSEPTRTPPVNGEPPKGAA